MQELHIPEMTSQEDVKSQVSQKLGLEGQVSNILAEQEGEYEPQS